MASDELLGVEDLAKFAKKSAATVRADLRRKKVKKTGKSYGWKNQAALQAQAKSLGYVKKSTPKKASTAAAA